MTENKIKIIAADDHPIVIDGLKLSLQDNTDITFIGDAYSETQLYSILQQCSPDILILDLNIKGDNSLSYLDQIYAIRPQIKIIIFSSYDTPSLIRSSLKTKINGYLLKDTPKEELIEAIYKVNSGERYISKNIKLENLDADNSNSFLIDDFLKKNNLSQRELEVIQWIVKGLTSDDIATQLFISKHTVQSHRKNILRKLSLHNKADIVKFAYENNLV